VAGTLTVTPAPLTITADNQTKVYGAALPVLTASYSGFVNGDTAASLTTPVSLATPATIASPVGTYAITAGGASSPNYAITFVNGTLTVTPAALTITANNQSKQYSEPVPALTATYSGFVLGQGPSDLTGALTCTTSAGPFSAPGTYAITCSGQSSSNYALTYVSGTLTVTQEDARVAYTGTTFASTGSGSTASVVLAATAQDFPDGAPGDIRNATVTFKDRASGAVLAANVPVVLVNPSDPTTGMATATVTLSIGTADAKTFQIQMIVNGYYTRNSSADDGLVTLSKVIPNSITGGGYTVASSSAGQYAADPGTRVNFGFNVRYNPSGINPQGHVTILFHRMVAGVLRTYQIRSTAIQSVGVNPATPNRAEFLSRATLTDITNPAAPVSLGGNLTLRITITDNGEPGTGDTIGITLTNSTGSLLFSNHWTGTPPRTTEQALAGGNLQVRGA
jgi:hypothetical protein